MRPPIHLPHGNVHTDFEKTVIEFAGPGENAKEALIFVGTCVWIGVFFWYAAAVDDAHPAMQLARFLLPILTCAMVVGFGVHYCTRFTLMDPAARRRALLLFFLVGLPLTFVPFSWALCLVAPRRCWDAFVSWLTYPDHDAPGLYRSPLGPPWLRKALSISFAFLPAFAAIAPVLLITEHEDQ